MFIVVVVKLFERNYSRSVHVMGQSKETIKTVKISDCKFYISTLLKGSPVQARSLLLLASNREVQCIISILQEILSLRFQNPQNTC